MTNPWLFALLILLTTTAWNPTPYSSWKVFSYAGPGLDQIGQLTVRHSREIEGSSWSVGCETLDRDYADFNAYREYLGELGVKKARLQSGWAKCEKEKGVYDFAWLDEIVEGVVEQGVEPWITLGYGNPLYGSDIRLHSGIFSDEETIEAWLDYVRALVTRYRGVVTQWEIWNEPKQAREYAHLMIPTAELIRELQPDATILGFALCDFPLDLAEDIFEIMKAEDKLDVIDYVSYHPYQYNPDDSYALVDKLKSLVHRYNPDLRLYQGENGCPSALEWSHALKDYPWTEVSQAKYLLRRMAGDRIRDIPSNLFTLIDLKYYNMLQSFGLLRSNLERKVVYKRASYYGVQHMVSIFDDTVRPLGLLDYHSTAYRPVTVAGFEKAGQPIALLWYGDRFPSDDFKWDRVALTIKGVRFADPVLVEMVSGKVYDLPGADWSIESDGTRFHELPLWDCVVMIAERGAVPME